MRPGTVTEPPVLVVKSVGRWMNRLKGDPWVTIRSCSDPQMWYAQQVSSQVLIERVDTSGLWARESPGGPINIIHFADAEF